MSDQSRWETADEIKFISSLGGHRDRPAYVNRVKLIDGYIRGLHYRQNWGLMDRSEVLTHALGERDSATERQQIVAMLEGSDFPI